MAMNKRSRLFSKGSRVRHSVRGLTIVELMVAMAVGLFIALAISLLTVSMGRQFRVTGANTSADVNAQLALSMIDQAGRSAGAGLYNNGQPLCTTLNAWRNGATISNGALFLPARITDGGAAGSSDTIVFSQGSASGGLSSMPVVDGMATVSDPVKVSGGGLINDGDYALVGVPGSPSVPCTLMQVTAAPTTTTACGGNASECMTLQRTGASTGVNPSTNPFTTAARYGFTNGGGISGPAVVNRLGNTFLQTAFGVLCESLVTYNAFTSAAPACTSATAFSGGANALVSDVVLVHAQYGVTDGSVVAGVASDVVTSWVDATGSWAAPSATNAARIRAVRVALVTRSKEADPQDVSSACTNGGGVVNTGPCGFDDASAPVVDVSGLSVPAGRTWRNYRYRVHQAIIPLRSVIWSN
jgi:type IV pilus assembly protein PilW